MSEYNTGLYVRKRGSSHDWELFLGGYTKFLPSELYGFYFASWKHLHKSLEWVVLERRATGKGDRRGMYRVGCTKLLSIYTGEEDHIAIKRDYKSRPKLVKCLSVWHDEIVDTHSAWFMGTVINRICPLCVAREHEFYLTGGRHD